MTPGLPKDVSRTFWQRPLPATPSPRLATMLIQIGYLSPIYIGDSNMAKSLTMSNLKQFKLNAKCLAIGMGEIVKQRQLNEKKWYGAV